MPGVLDGIRVVEFAAQAGGPMAGLILGDFGAEVIKIERPGTGDSSRLIVQPGARTVPPGNYSGLFEHVNRGKKSITLDVTTEKGRKIIQRFIEKSDAFYSNYFPQNLRSLGLDYQTVVKYNPRLVYATSHSYGREGPDSDKQSYDPMALARSGMLMAIGDSDGTPGGMIPGAIADCMGGTFLGLAVMIGLLARERLGIGQEIDASLFGPMIWAQYVDISQYLVGIPTMPKQRRKDTTRPLSNSYRCKDGRWLFILVRDVTKWPFLCRLLGNESLGKDPRFDDQIKQTKNNLELIKILDGLFAAKTRDEWLALFKAEKAEKALILTEVVNTIPDLVNDPQVLANRYIVDENHRGLGHVKMMRFPWTFSKTPVASARTAAPVLGEQTDEVLKEMGYSDKEIEEFKQEKVV